MASSTSSIPKTFLPPASFMAATAAPSTPDSKPIKRKFGLGSPSSPQAIPRLPYTPPGSDARENHTAATNWNSYNANSLINANHNRAGFVGTPALTMSPMSSRSSVTSSPIDQTTQAQVEPTTPSYFNPVKPRSKSFAMPIPTACCSSCGLRRTSTVPDLAVSPPPSSIQNTKNPFIYRPHLPMHMHREDFCPDEPLPSKDDATSPIASSPYHKHRFHRRRRSSLCYTESLVDDAEAMDNGGIDTNVKAGWERQADKIARRIALRESCVGSIDAGDNETVVMD